MPPILSNKDASARSVFRPEALLREARRQKGLPAVDVPSVCILDPDGDIVRRLRQDGRARPFESWPCYHTGPCDPILDCHTWQNMLISPPSNWLLLRL